MDHDRRFIRRGYGGPMNVRARPYHMNPRANSNGNFWPPPLPRSGIGSYNNHPWVRGPGPGVLPPPGPPGPNNWRPRSPLNFHNDYHQRPPHPPPLHPPPIREEPPAHDGGGEGGGEEDEVEEAERVKSYKYSNSLSAIMSSLSRDPQVMENERKRRSDSWNVPLSNVIDKGAFPMPKKKFKFMENLYCEVCNIELTSETVMQSHISGMRHLKKLQNLKRMNPARAEELDHYGFEGVTDRRPDVLKFGAGASGGPKKRIPGQPGSLAKLLENSEQPVVGAEHLEEYSGGPDAKFEPVYYCTLCSAHALYEIMYQHVIGVKHRTKYMKEHHGKDNLSKSQLRQEASQIERETGRQLSKIKSITGLTSPPDFGKLKTEKSTEESGSVVAQPSLNVSANTPAKIESQGTESEKENEEVPSDESVPAPAEACEENNVASETNAAEINGVEVVAAGKPPPPVVDVESGGDVEMTGTSEEPGDASSEGGGSAVEVKPCLQPSSPLPISRPVPETKQERTSDSEEEKAASVSLEPEALDSGRSSVQSNVLLSVAVAVPSSPPAVPRPVSPAPCRSPEPSSSSVLTSPPGLQVEASSRDLSSSRVTDDVDKDQKPAAVAVGKKAPKCEGPRKGPAKAGRNKTGILENRVGGIIGSLIGCTIKVESDIKLAVNVSGSLLSNLLTWHKNDNPDNCKDVEKQRKKPEAVPLLESILDNIKRYVDLLQLPDVIDMIRNREMVNSTPKSETRTVSTETAPASTVTSDVAESMRSSSVSVEAGASSEAVIAPNLTQIPGLPGMMMVVPAGNVEQIQEMLRQFAKLQGKSSTPTTSSLSNNAESVSASTSTETTPTPPSTAAVCAPVTSEMATVPASSPAPKQQEQPVVRSQILEEQPNLGKTNANGIRSDRVVDSPLEDRDSNSLKRESMSISPTASDMLDPRVLTPAPSIPSSSNSDSGTVGSRLTLPLISNSLSNQSSGSSTVGPTSLSATSRQLANARGALYPAECCSPPSSVFKDKSGGLSSVVGVAFSPVSPDGGDDDDESVVVGFDDAFMSCLGTPAPSPPVAPMNVGMSMANMSMPMQMQMPSSLMISPSTTSHMQMPSAVPQSSNASSNQFSTSSCMPSSNSQFFTASCMPSGSQFPSSSSSSVPSSVSFGGSYSTTQSFSSSMMSGSSYSNVPSMQSSSGAYAPVTSAQMLSMSSYLPGIVTDGDMRYSLSPCWTNPGNYLPSMDGLTRSSSYQTHDGRQSFSSGPMGSSSYSASNCSSSALSTAAAVAAVGSLSNFFIPTGVGGPSSSGHEYETGLPPLMPFEPPLESIAPSTIVNHQPHPQRGHRSIVVPEDPEELFNVARMKGKMKLLPAKHSTHS